MESLDIGHTTVKTENSQPGLSQGQDPSSRVLLRSTRVATAFFGEAVLMMELPKRHSTPSEGGRFAPIKSSDYGGRPLTGPRPDDLLELRLVAWFGWADE